MKYAALVIFFFCVPLSYAMQVDYGSIEGGDDRIALTERFLSRAINDDFSDVSNRLKQLQQRDEALEDCCASHLTAEKRGNDFGYCTWCGQYRIGGETNYLLAKVAAEEPVGSEKIRLLLPYSRPGLIRKLHEIHPENIDIKDAVNTIDTERRCEIIKVSALLVSGVSLMSFVMLKGIEHLAK